MDAGGSTTSHVKVLRTLGGNAMKRYRVREGSIFDYARYGITGAIFGVLMGIVINSAYPM